MFGILLRTGQALAKHQELEYQGETNGEQHETNANGIAVLLLFKLNAFAGVRTDNGFVIEIKPVDKRSSLGADKLIEMHGFNNY